MKIHKTINKMKARWPAGVRVGGTQRGSRGVGGSSPGWGPCAHQQTHLGKLGGNTGM